MTTADGNIFRHAQQLLRDKSVLEMNEEEQTTVNAATIPLTILPEFNDMTTLEGLEALAKMVDGIENGSSRRREDLKK